MFKLKQLVGGRHEGDAGFTLLEVIIAISILTVGLLAVGSMQTAAIHGNDTAYHVTEGATWAQNRIEALIALPYNDPLLDNGIDKADPTPPTPDGYSITYDVSDGPVENTKLITVIATEQGRGVTKVRQLTYIKSNL